MSGLLSAQREIVTLVIKNRLSVVATKSGVTYTSKTGKKIKLSHNDTLTDLKTLKKWLADLAIEKKVDV